MRPHAPYADVLEIARLLHEYEADSLICVGGSSYSDACKVARLVHANLPASALVSSSDGDGDETAIHSLSRNGSRAHDLRAPSVKLICVPCSLSASEYNSIGSATSFTGSKHHFGDAATDSGAPELILLDPCVAATAPADTLWLPSGVRAIDHCIETLLNPSCNAECAATAESGLRLLLKGLSDYKTHLSPSSNTSTTTSSQDALLTAISTCQLGARSAITGIIVYKNPCGPSHAIGRQLGATAGVPHGLTSCVCLAPVLRYEARHPESGFWDVGAQGRVVDVFREVLGWGEMEAGEAVERFVGDVLGLPTRLGEVGIRVGGGQGVGGSVKSGGVGGSVVSSGERVNGNVDKGEDNQKTKTLLERIAQNTLSDYWGNGPIQIESAEEIVGILESVL